jgi:hypothetical protein
MKNMIRILLTFIVVTANLPTMASADEVTEWNQILLDSLITANVTGFAPSRAAAIVHSAVYDAVNGIERRYTPLHVEPAAAPGASRRAAAVQAAYATLVKLFPAQASTLNAKRDASLSAISSEESVGNSQSVARGIEWGQTVADAILAWRSTDGFTPTPPPYVGGSGIGQWQPTPTAFLPFGGLQFATMTPWVIQSPSQFPLPGPPALSSAQYATDFNEVKQMGGIISASRTLEQTNLARFWASSNSPNYFWNRVAVSLAAKRHTTLSENARLFALLNVAIADAAISVWNKKLLYLFWRPITAIQVADLDGNVGTTSDPTWTPLLTTPPYPDYPSGLVGLSSGGVAVLVNFFGDNTPFTLDSNGMPGVTRSFQSFSAALDEAVDARVFSGIHFRFADVDARHLGTAVGNYVIANAFHSMHGERNGQIQK